MMALERHGLNFKKEEVLKMIDEVDFIGKNRINYSEFLSATLSCQKVLTDELLWNLFKSFDIDDTNYISVSNLREVFKRLGRYEITEEEIKEAIKVHDFDGNNQLSFTEFKIIFLDDKSAEVDALIMNEIKIDVMNSMRTVCMRGSGKHSLEVNLFGRRPRSNS
jgi:Ca2+-binding EF-hand superfamily protein